MMEDIVFIPPEPPDQPCDMTFLRPCLPENTLNPTVHDQPQAPNVAMAGAPGGIPVEQ